MNGIVLQYAFIPTLTTKPRFGFSTGVNQSKTKAIIMQQNLKQTQKHHTEPTKQL